MAVYSELCMTKEAQITVVMLVCKFGHHQNDLFVVVVFLRVLIRVQLTGGKVDNIAKWLL